MASWPRLGKVRPHSREHRAKGGVHGAPFSYIVLGAGALPPTARIGIETLLRACAHVREHAGAEASWALGGGWARKEGACRRLLAPYGGVVGVSEAEPLPDALLTVAPI